jgi:hypothetical protein
VGLLPRRTKEKSVEKELTIHKLDTEQDKETTIQLRDPGSPPWRSTIISLINQMAVGDAITINRTE